MDTIWLFVAFMLLILFSSISIIGALRRIATATEQTATDVQALLAAVEKSNSQP
jgi:hypothetical protein